MKLRLSSDTLRLRLSRSDTARLADERRLEESLQLENGRFSYVLEISEDPGPVAARLEPGRIAVSLPANEADEWLGSERLGIESNNAGVRILVEKDLADH